MAKRPITISLSVAEMRLVLDSLDSHEYWQLSEQRYRSNGFVDGEGSADPETRAQIRRVRALYTRIEFEIRKCAKRARRSSSPAASG